MPKIQGNFANGDQLPDRDYVDGDASGPGLNQVLDKTNAAPHVFATVAEAELAEYSEPETVAVAETSQFYVYDSSSALTRDGFWVLNTVGAGRLVSILLGYVLSSGRSGGQVLNGGNTTTTNLELHSNTAKNGLIKLGDNSAYNEDNNRLGIGIKSPAAPLHIATSPITYRGTLVTQVQSNTAPGFFLEETDTSTSYAFTANTGRLKIFVKNGLGDLVPTDEAISILTNGSVGFGITNPTARIHAKGASSTSADYAFKAVNSSGTNILSGRNDGLVSFRYYDMPNEALAEGEILVANSSGNLVPVLPAYGEAYQNDNANETTVSVQNTWYEIDNFTTGETQGITVAGGAMTIGTGQNGVYSLAASISGVPESTGHVFEFSFSVNDTILTKTKAKRKFSSTTDAGSVSLHGLSNLSASDVVKLEIRNITTGTNASFTVENSSMVIHRID